MANEIKPPATLCRRLTRLTVVVLGIALTPLVLLSCFQSKVIYFPRPYEPGKTSEWKADTDGKAIDYNTSQGKQRAFLQGKLKSPRNLWVVCGGNGTVALDWSEWLMEHAPAEDAWLLVDFPGYGDSEGKPSPKTIRENLATAVPIALKEVGITDQSRLRFFGHSLGAAACLIASQEFGIQRGVLISPFTSTMDMAKHMTRLPIGFLVWHRFDNSERLKELAARGPGHVVILHGTDDESIPYAMSEKLAAEHQRIVRLVKIDGGRHNTIHDTNTMDVEAALREIGDR